MDRRERFFLFPPPPLKCLFFWPLCRPFVAHRFSAMDWWECVCVCVRECVRERDPTYLRHRPTFVAVDWIKREKSWFIVSSVLLLTRRPPEIIPPNICHTKKIESFPQNWNAFPYLFAASRFDRCPNWTRERSVEPFFVLLLENFDWLDRVILTFIRRWCPLCVIIARQSAFAHSALDANWA